MAGSWKLLGFLTVILLVIILAGCGTGSPGNAAGVLSSLQTETPFTIAVPADIANFTPGMGGSTGSGVTYLYDALTRRSQIDQHIIPGLAESWSNIDPKTWRFNLRKDVSFHLGGKLTASDVKYTFNRILGKEEANFRSPLMVTWNSKIESIETPDDYTVIFKTREADVSFPTTVSLTFIVPKTYSQEAGSATFDSKPSGTGPYLLTERKKMELHTLSLFPGYWNTKPDPGSPGPGTIKKVTYRVIPEEQTRIAALQSGEVDGATDIKIENARMLEKRQGIKIYYSQINRSLYIAMNWRDEKDPVTGASNPFCDVRVRQALNHAIDVENIIANYLTGKEYRTTLVGRGGAGFNQNVPFYKFDPDRAKQLLREAGYASGFKTIFNLPQVLPEHEAIFKYWKDVGIEVETKVVTTEMITRAVGNKSLNGMHVGIGPGGPDPTATWFPTNVPYDSATALHGRDENAERLAALSAAEFDPVKRAKLIDEVIQIMWKDAWYVPLWEQVSQFAMSDAWVYEHQPASTAVVVTGLKGKK